MPHNERIEEAVSAVANLVQAVSEVSSFLNRGTSDTHEVGTRSFLASTASTLAAYAWEGTACTEISLEEGLAELSAAAELLGANFMLPDGTECLDKAAKEAVQRLANAADARWQLDQGHPVRVEQLAALAGVAEKTVRAATNPKGSNPLPVSKSGYWTFIEADDALVWLGRRNDFKVTRHVSEGVDQPLISDATTLANVCQRARAHFEQPIEQVATTLKWSKAQASAYQDIEAKAPGDIILEFPPKVLLQLARHLQLPDPNTFARQAYTVLALAHASALSDQLAASNH